LRLTRLWLRPGFRRLANFGLPMLAGVLAAWTLMAEYDLRGRVEAGVEAARAAIVTRPQFMITRIETPDASEDLGEQIRIAAFVTLPASSLEVNVAAVRDRIESLHAVERARVRALPSGALEIRAIERVPVVVWRGGETVVLLDQRGVRVAEVDSRLRRPDLPLVAGEGADRQVPEALAILEMAGPIRNRVRGLVRMGERRWDVVLDRGQVIRLPEAEPAAALGRVMALQVAEGLLERDLTVVDMRDPRRPMLRLTEHATAELMRLRAMVKGEDA
jgi:cell division protein FtsQ